MKLTNEEIVAIVEHELQHPSLSVTTQHIEVHEPVFENGQLVYLITEREDNTIVVYLPVRNQLFYFVLYIDAIEKIVYSFSTEAWYRVYYRATSETLSEKELKSLTQLVPNESWNKGDVMKHGKAKFSFSMIKFLPNPEPDEFDNKLEKLLSFLEKDKKGITLLNEKADAGIQVAVNFHNGNGMLGGFHLSENHVGRLNSLNLSIDFDLYSEGNSFKS